MISREAVLEYREIYKKVYGKEISYNEGLEQGTRLLRLFRIIYRPIPKAWINKSNNKNHGS
jgi:hypothetical protein